MKTEAKYTLGDIETDEERERERRVRQGCILSLMHTLEPKYSLGDIETGRREREELGKTVYCHQPFKREVC